MSINKHVLLAYLEGRRYPVSQLDGAALLHSTLCEAAPLFYLHLLTDRATDVSHKREILWNWLTHPSARTIDHQHVLNWLNVLPGEQALKIIELVSDLRINRSRARTLVLSFLIGHGRFALFAATRKRRIIRLLKHVLGERTWSSAKRALAETSPEGEALLKRELLGYAREGEVQQVREALLFLADLPLPEQVHEPLLKKSEAARRILELGESLPLETLSGLRGIYHKETPLQKVRKLSAPSQRSLHMEGQLTTAYKELLAGNQQTTAGQAVGLQEQLQQAIQGLPHLAGQLAIVLDLSASMASSGERLYYPAALALVMVQQLRDLVREVVLVQVGGSDPALQHFSPAPQGASDLATGLLDALRSQPDLVIIISDGYENQRQGDVAQVVAGLKQLEINVPIYQVVPLFASSENLEQRVFGAGIPVLPLTHEQDIRDLLTYALLASAEESLTLREMEQLQQIWYGEV
jgi:hypothetical protein